MSVMNLRSNSSTWRSATSVVKRMDERVDRVGVGCGLFENFEADFSKAPQEGHDDVFFDREVPVKGPWVDADDLADPLDGCRGVSIGDE